eukprot:1587355-Pyramimonas_sp.AAC.1
MHLVTRPPGPTRRLARLPERARGPTPSFPRSLARMLAPASERRRNRPPCIFYRPLDRLDSIRVGSGLGRIQVEPCPAIVGYCSNRIEPDQENSELGPI